MSYEHKPGSFSLFKNDKGDNEKRPDYRGEGKDLDGNDIEVSAWIRDGARGKFISCAFKLRGEVRPPARATAQAMARQAKAELAAHPSDLDDDIPF